MSDRQIMGRSIGAAEADALLGGDTMAVFRNQLLICTVERLGGTVVIPVREVDGTGAFMMALEIDQIAGTFTLKTEKKQ
jgi:hypothetical protein